jgi:GT2 family glycosyltransferase
MDNWVLIPCHNNSALLRDCLKSVLAQTIPVRIFAINNGSKDNTAQVLESLGPEHIVVHKYPQLGVAGAWNYGANVLFDTNNRPRVREAIKGSQENQKLRTLLEGLVLRLLVINQDVVLRPDTYDRLLKEDSDFVTAVSTSDLHKLHQSGGAQCPGAGRRPHPDFSCFLISQDCFRRVGEFDTGFYPAWFEDNDYHIRASRAGIEAYCIDLPFYHYAAGTMKTASDYDKAHYYGPGFLKSKERFMQKWGVLPGTKEYEELCRI